MHLTLYPLLHTSHMYTIQYFPDFFLIFHVYWSIVAVPYENRLFLHVNSLVHTETLLKPVGFQYELVSLHVNKVFLTYTLNFVVKFKL